MRPNRNSLMAPLVIAALSSGLFAASASSQFGHSGPAVAPSPQRSSRGLGNLKSRCNRVSVKAHQRAAKKARNVRRHRVACR